MRPHARTAAALAAALALAALAAPPAAAAPAPGAYRADDAGGFRNVLPPGSNGLANAGQLAVFLAGGPRPPHSDDEYARYRDLLYAAPGLRAEDVERYFKDASFGVRPGDAERTYSPREDVTIVRDRGFGVPRIYGETRDGALFGVGYASAEDRLFFMDILRHVGRGKLSSFAGGSPGTRAFDQLIWRNAPYTEEERSRQLQGRPPGFEEESDRLRRDLEHYVAGVNAYIAEARLDPTKMPGEYAAIDRPQGPDGWKPEDVVSTATLIGSIFGVGGGREVDSALVLEAARKRFGRRRGDRVWRDFRQVDDPEGPTTVRGKRFRFGLPPKRRRGVALPDRGSVEKTGVVAETTGPEAPPAPGGSAALGRGPLAFPKTSSNALLVSARESASGRPLAVFGPQVAYFAPQVLMEMEIHAPGLDARGAAFPGASLFVQLGRGRNYAWSATTSAQDVIDTFAVDLCEPDGSRPTTESMHYLFHGRCLPIEVLEQRNEWEPNAADPTPAGHEVLRAERTKMGLVEARATIRGRPVAYTRLRSTYLHEPDGGLAVARFNDPDRITGPREFQETAALIPFTFNWFYVDEDDIAYQQSGSNPVRARGTDPSLPIRGRSRYEWRGWDPDTNTARYASRRRLPNVINQSFIQDWNGKQARGYAAADGNWGYGSIYRSNLLGERIANRVNGRRKTTLPELIDAMEDAGTVDLRGSHVLPLLLRVLGRPEDPELRSALSKLRRWQRGGAHRIDRDRDGTYEHSEAIRIMDAWWPRLVRAAFEPTLGEELFERIAAINELENHPNNHGDHVGSAWQDGWHSYVHRDLRALLGLPVRGRYSRLYCGGGRRSLCRSRLERALSEALAVPAADLYAGDAVCAAEGRAGDQACWDSIWFRPLGGITHPVMPWVNRPTFQQVVEVGGG